MSLLTILWATCAAACAILGLLHLMLWHADRRTTAYLLLSIASFSAATSAILEWLMMRATSVAAYAELVRWENLVIFSLLLSLVWAVDRHLATGRRWLASLITLLWSISIAINFLLPGSLVFSEVYEIEQHSTPWGESFSFAVGERNPWALLADLASLLILAYFIDSAWRAWCRGARSQALAVAVAAAGFILIGGVHTPLVDAGVVQTPYMISMAFLIMVVAMSY